MGHLKHHQSEVRVRLPARCLVGRSHLCHLRLSARSISGEHALVRWIGPAWEVQDLGSRNGTFVDGRRIAPGEHVALQHESQISFGDTSDPWLLDDVGPPVLMAVHCHSGQTVCATDGLLVLPDSEHPIAVAYYHASGEWVLEQEGQVSVLAEQSIIHVAGGRWRIHLPLSIPGTWEPPSGHVSIDGLILCFRVSTDEEYVHLLVHQGSRVIDLRGRSHHYTLLLLARARLTDQQQGVSTANQGWMYLSDLQSMTKVDEKHLNILIHRARRQMIDAGITEGARLIERRIGTGQLRLGIAQIEIRDA